MANKVKPMTIKQKNKRKIKKGAGDRLLVVHIPAVG
jgi:hypothetical protein